MNGTFYLAGPMTGRPQFNFPAFHSAAAELRERGYTIISPAEEDAPEVRKAAMHSLTGALDHNSKIAGHTWGDILSRDVKLVADHVDGIVLLRDWESSKGARLEAFVGLLCKKKFLYHLPGQRPLGVVSRHVLNKIHDYTRETL